MNTLIAAAVLLAAGSVSATEINWNAPAASFNAAMTEAAVKVAPVAAVELAAEDVSGEIKIMGVAMGQNAFPTRRRVDSVTLQLVLNNTKDRVAAELSVCERPDAEIEYCDTVRFSIPGLAYDKKLKAVVLGQNLVQVSGKMTPGFKLGYTKTTRVDDHGFDKVKKDVYQVYLAKSSK